MEASAGGVVGGRAEVPALSDGGGVGPVASQDALEDVAGLGDVVDTAEQPAAPEPGDGGLDVNAVVSYNVKAIRERRGWTQQSVAERLGRLTGHQLPQASISAMERGFDGDRRRRFDAHELYLLSVAFDVPIAYFFVPPPGTGFGLLTDTRRPVAELYMALLGKDHQLPPLDDRLAEIKITNPEESDAVQHRMTQGKVVRRCTRIYIVEHVEHVSQRSTGSPAGDPRPCARR